MENVKKYLPWTIRILISFLFIISAVAKMYPSPYFAISTFEVKQLYPMGFSEDLAAYFSRTLIGFEMALGLLILQPHYLKKIIVPTTFIMLAVFVAQLSIETLQTGGNTGNCGCFGSLLPMTPIEAIMKNIVSMIMLGYLYLALPEEHFGRKNFWVLSTITLATILAIFMLAPIQPKSEIPETSEVIPEPVETIAPVVTDSILTTPVAKDSVSKIKTTVEVAKPIVDEPAKHKSGYGVYFSKIDQGKKVLCFFVPGCEHCREVAKELTEMKQKDKNFPEINIIFMNEEADLIPDFFKFAGREYPYKIIEIIPFWKLLGTGKDTPGVKYLWNGNEYKYYYGITDQKFNAAEFQKIIKKPYSELK